MKKLFALIFALLMLCACVAEEEPVVEEPKEPVPESSESEAEIPENLESKPEEWPKVSIKNSGKFPAEETVFEDGSKIIKILDSEGNQIGVDYKSLRFLGETPLCQYAGEIDGKATRLFYDENGDPYSEEINATYCYILDENGQPVVDRAFESFYIAPGADITLRGISEGGLYDYYEEDGKLNPVYFDEAFEEDWGSGFSHTGYFYNNGGAGFWRYGIKKNDEVLYDNIYTGILPYFGDRFMLWTERENGDNKSVIGEENGNIICDKFQSFGWKPVSEEKCIGTASVGKQERGEYAPTFDENGEPMPEGMWFIDKDGNILSERFEYIELIFDGNKEVPWVLDSKLVCVKAAKVTYENGETEIIDIAPYLLDY
ncbi:MAG: hypothetical protein IJE28_06845 [Oscillospiraceae bacterium]|nr:hypothetical protein [Oscillospiraceae bacterium]